MKKIFLLFLVGILSICCTERENLSESKLLGTWDIYSSNGNLVEDDCEKQNKFIFSENFVIEEQFRHKILEDECEEFESRFKYKLDNNKLVLFTDKVSHSYDIRVQDNTFSLNVKGIEVVFKKR